MRKSILCLLLSVILVFNSGYKAHVEAFSLVVIGSVTLGEALLYCACVVGTTVAVVETEKHFQEQQMETLQNSDVYEPYGEEMLQDFKNWCSNCPQYVDVTTRNIEDWLANVVEGTLDKGSDVWSAFKDYICHVNDVQGEIVSNTGSQVCEVTYDQVKQALSNINVNELSKAYVQVPQFYSESLVLRGTTSDDYLISDDAHSVSVILEYSDGTSLLLCLSSDYATKPSLIGSFSYGCIDTYKTSNGKYYGNFSPCYNSKVIDGCPSFGGMAVSYTHSSDVDYRIKLNFGPPGSRTDKFAYDSVYKRIKAISPMLNQIIIASGVINGYWDFSIPVTDWGIADDVVIDKNVQDVIERDGTLDNVDVWGYGDMTLDKDDVISIDWDNVTVGDMARPYVGGQTLAVDLVDGIDINTDTPIEDIPVLPVAIRDSYTIPKLETVFPFCIPFDLVKIFTLFKAEPDAPHFTWTFYFGIGELKPYTIEIDLDPFNSVAEIVRLLELIGFLVFLTLKTRDLIRG